MAGRSSFAEETELLSVDADKFLTLFLLEFLSEGENTKF